MIDLGTFPPVVYFNVLSTFACFGWTVKEHKVESKQKSIIEEALG